MKLCIPVSTPDGLESYIEPDLPRAEYLLFFDTETRLCNEISLREDQAGAAESIQIDAVLCSTINRATLRTLIEQGIKVYATEARTVVQAIAQYEDGELGAAVAEAHGCAGHGHAQGHAGSCCSDGHARGESGQHDGAGSHHCHGEGGGCGGEGKACSDEHAGDACCASNGPRHEAVPSRPCDDVLRIAVSSQNRKTVTEHAGKCRKFWIFEVRQGQVIGKTLLELPIDQSFHSAPAGRAHPLDTINVLITSGMGSGLQQRLLQRGVQALVTTEANPEQAVAAYLAGEIQPDQDARRHC